MTRAFAIAFLMAVMASGVFAEPLPSSGACSARLSDIPGVPKTSVTWRGDTASVEDVGKVSAGEVAGLRAHDDGFKLSVFYDDPIVGTSEMIVFSMRLADEWSYRLGVVSYDEGPDGARVIGYMSGFWDADCELGM